MKIKKYKRPKQKTSEGKSKFLFIATTLIFLLVCGTIALIVCWSYYQWTWEMVGEILNPMVNGYATFIYIGLIVLIWAIIWLIHEYKTRKGVNNK